MSLVVVIPPAALLTLAEAKAHLRVDGADEDAYIAGLIAAAQGTIDGPMGWLGRSLGVQTLELRAPGFDGFGGGDLVLPCGPVIDVLALAYVAVGGALTVLDPAAYAVDADGRIGPMLFGLWPSVQLRRDAVRVRYRAGYPPSDGDAPVPTVPAPILHAMKVMIGLLYENRLGAADLQTNATVASLLGPFRVWGR